jgi:hypothetical protein
MAAEDRRRLEEDKAKVGTDYDPLLEVVKESASVRWGQGKPPGYVVKQAEVRKSMARGLFP